MTDNNIFTSVDSLSKLIQELKLKHKIGFVPTMGALHHGHISLVEKAFEYADYVVVSVFVNPTQFNKTSDLELYPRTLSADLKLLESFSNLIVFNPSVEEMYPSTFESVTVDLGDIANVMEGKFRTGHFDGVMNVVKRFFDIIEPDYAFFGEKDFQQLAVIQFMVKQLNLSVEIVPCEIIREDSGLASSSRNARLSEKDKEIAILISKSLSIAKELAFCFSPFQVKEIIRDLYKFSKLNLEYFDIVDPITLKSLTKWMPGAHACVATFCDEVRLIDNMQLTENKIK